jgi:peptidoglycan hydrolase-like protein with peptidoglycan-binding domain
VLALTAAPSGAHNLSGHRFWNVAQHDTLGTNFVSTGNVVGFWQSFLLTYHTIPCSGVDGAFGPQTRNATISIQNFFGITPDGIVGNQTYWYASNWLVQAGSDGFITTYWEPAFNTGPYYPLYKYIYSSDWQWQVPGVVAPFEQDLPTNHPSISFTGVPGC